MDNPKNSQKGMRPVSMRDIAERCGVSVPTVSRALRDPERHSPELTQRIQQVADELGYDLRRYSWARRLVMSRLGKPQLNHLIGVMLPHHFYRDTYYSRMLQSLFDELATQGYGALVLCVSPAVTTKIPPSFYRGDVDALIIATSFEACEPVLNELAKEPFFNERPIISMMSVLPGCAAVVPDAEGGAYAAAAHLLELGHRHIAYCVPPPEERISFGTHQDQFPQGHQRACQLYGLDPAHTLKPYVLDSWLWREYLATAVVPGKGKSHYLQAKRHPLVKFLQANPGITAILAPNDPAAVTITKLLRHAGIRVPEDISIIGYDDSARLLNEFDENILTTVRVPVEKIAQTAARITIDALEGKITGDTRITLPVELVLRQTSASPSAARSMA
ncbi:MAG TPA: LacI family DNA-binding transcriptional regulator [Armatimonadota bacterium]|jgi:LacI family transcriptional regulator